MSFLKGRRPHSRFHGPPKIGLRNPLPPPPRSAVIAQASDLVPLLLPPLSFLAPFESPVQTVPRGQRAPPCGERKAGSQSAEPSCIQAEPHRDPEGRPDFWHSTPQNGERERASLSLAVGVQTKVSTKDGPISLALPILVNGSSLNPRSHQILGPLSRYNMYPFNWQQGFARSFSFI